MNTMYYHRKKLFFIPLALAGIALLVYLTMILWNALLPQLFNLSAIGYWQAAGLLILARLLFGFGHGGHRPRWTGPKMDHELRSKIRNMSSEERKEFFRKMHYDRAAWCREHYMGNVTDEKSGEQDGK